MITVRKIDSPENASQYLQVAERLLGPAPRGIPFHGLDVPLAWWRNFNNGDGTDFGAKRGRNFWGASSKVERFHLLVAEEAGEACGLVPLVTTSVKVQGRQEPLRMLAFPADSALIAYQDFLVRPEGGEAALEALFQGALRLLSEEHDCMFLGYIPERSPNLPWLRAAAERCLAGEWSGGMRPNRRRGGVHPWTLHPILDALKKLRAKAAPGDARTAALDEAVAKLEAVNPGMLFFAKTRQNLERMAGEAASAWEADEAAGPEVRTLREQLSPAAIQYPYLDLPKDREAYLADLSHDTRRYFNRYKRKFLEAGGSFEKVAGEAITPADIDEYLQLHLMRWGADSVAVRDTTFAFHRDLSLALAKRGRFTLFFAWQDGKRIASHSCLDIGGRREGFFNGRDPAYEESRAGRLLYMETLYDAFDSGMTEYNFGLGGYDYKTSFTKTFSNTHNLFLSPKSRPVDPETIFLGYEYMALDG